MAEVSSANSQDLASSRWPQNLGLGRFGPAAIVLFATLVVVLGWSLGLLRIHNDREITLTGSHQQLATLSKALASQIEAMVNDGVGAARAGANVMTDFPPGAQQQALGEMLTGGSYVRALFVVVGERVLIANAPGENLTRSSAQWLDEIRASTERTWVGQVAVEGAGGSLNLPVARRISRADGIDSWAGALIRLSDLEQVYVDLMYSRTSVSIVSLDGRVLIQLPQSGSNPLNTDIRESDVYQRFLALPRQPITLITGEHPLTHEPRQFAVSRMTSLPLLASAGRAVGDALLQWRKRSIASVSLLTVATALVYTLAIALQRLLNRRFLALTRSEQRFQLAAAGTHDGLLEWESDTGMIYCTPRARELLRLPDTASYDLDAIRRLVHPDCLASATTAFRRHVDDGVPLDMELQLLCGGQCRWFRIRGQAQWNQRHEPIRLAGSIGDIHDAMLAQKAVAEARAAELHAKESLARELLQAQERERKRLASELHDGVGQNMSLLRNRVIMLQRSGLPAAALPHAQALLDLATESIEELRSVAQNLRPANLEELGVTAALRSLLHKVEQSSELKVQYRIEDVDDVIAGAAATQVYRIVQEAVNNVLRHAAAKNLRVDVIRDISWVIIDIRDDGKGFDAGGGSAREGLGLLSMGERCSILHADLQVESGRQMGTRLRVRIPISSTAAGELGAAEGESDV